MSLGRITKVEACISQRLQASYGCGSTPFQPKKIDCTLPRPRYPRVGRSADPTRPRKERSIPATELACSQQPIIYPDEASYWASQIGTSTQLTPLFPIPDPQGVAGSLSCVLVLGMSLPKHARSFSPATERMTCQIHLLSYPRPRRLCRQID